VAGRARSAESRYEIYGAPGDVAMGLKIYPRLRVTCQSNHEYGASPETADPEISSRRYAESSAGIGEARLLGMIPFLYGTDGCPKIPLVFVRHRCFDKLICHE